MQQVRIQRNAFEMAAHNLEVNWRKPRPAGSNNWPEGVRD